MEEKEVVVGISHAEIEKLVDLIETVRPVQVNYSPNYIEMLQETISKYQDVVESVYVNLLNRL